MNIAVFLDRDGTINEQMGYINHIDRFRLLPGSAEAIALLNLARLKVVVVSNQSGAFRGYFPASLITEVNQHMEELLSLRGAHLDATFTCQHGPREGCSCRKPRPGMLEQAASKLDLDLQRSYVVGDRFSDIELAANAGARGIMVLTGYGRGELENYQGPRPVKPTYIAQDLWDAARWILSDLNLDDLVKSPRLPG